MSDKPGLSISFGTNFDPEILTAVKEMDTRHRVNSIYGKLKNDILGGGRPGFRVKNLKLKELLSYAQACREQGIDFNYLFNAICLDNREIIPVSHRNIIKFVKQLVEGGINSFTVNSTYICQVLKHHFPDIKIYVGAYAGVFSLQQIKYWEDLGAQSITLSSHYNRSLRQLEKFLEYTKTTGTELRLVVNNACVHSCPSTIAHGSFQAHASQKNHRSNIFAIDVNLWKCTVAKMRNPVKFLSSPWIRPEDVSLLESICEKTGNYNLNIKLSGREASSEFILRSLRAYVEGSWDGNLLEILNWPGAATRQVTKGSGAMMEILFGGYNLEKLALLREMFPLPEIYIDNKKLGGFFKKFYTDWKCVDYICDTGPQGEHPTEGSHLEERYCGYCKSWVEKAIRYDKEEMNKWLAIADEFLGSLDNSTIFGYK